MAKEGRTIQVRSILKNHMDLLRIDLHMNLDILLAENDLKL